MGCDDPHRCAEGLHAALAAPRAERTVSVCFTGLSETAGNAGAPAGFALASVHRAARERGGRDAVAVLPQARGVGA
ncbi:hypothetical protein NS44R_15015 [Mammaliicoccus sciuri]|nr:hypothetical protein NS44R_15015 [Mammaliicoccus sciuri]